MKKRVLSALLVLCLACGLVSTAWAADGQATPETAAVSVTDAASGETADAADYPARTVEQTVPGTDVTVQVEVPEGALPEDAELTTALVGSSEDAADDQAVADVASELDKADVEYDGFVALDISFADAAGNKVEPLQPVSVNFTLPAELLPEDVDASTLEVQHLEENAAGEVENVETVADTADATEGTVTVDGAAATLSEDADTTLPADAQVTAEFTVDGFSTFTITWSNRYGSQAPVTFQCYDMDGTKLPNDAKPANTTMSSGQTLNFSADNSKLAINGYTFDHAEYGNQTLKQLKAEASWKSSGWFGGYWSWTYTLTYENGTTDSLSAAPTINLYYTDTGDSGSSGGGVSINNGLNTVDTIDSIEKGVHMYLFNYPSTGPFTGAGYWQPTQGQSYYAYRGHVWQGIASAQTASADENDPFYSKFPTLNDSVYDETTNRSEDITPASGYTRDFASFFDPDQVSGAIEVNHLFSEKKYNESKTFYYSSFENFATIIEDDCIDPESDVRNFKVYDALGSPEVYGWDTSKANDSYFFYQRGNFLPYNTLDASDIYTHQYYDESGNKITSADAPAPVYGLYDANGNKLGNGTSAAEYQFGMYMYASFYQPKDGLYNNQEMVYNFTGDDDMWVYIDGVLVLDLGGTHDALSGSINFTTGVVTYQYKANQLTTGNVSKIITRTTTIKDMFEQAGVNLDELRWDSERSNTFADGTFHTIQMFYMERGGGASNLKMSFNLPTVPDGSMTVRKNVENYFNAQMQDIEYTMQLLDGDGTPITDNKVMYYLTSEDESKKRPLEANGTFTLKHDETAIIEGLTGDSVVQVKEIDVSPKDDKRIDELYSANFVVTNSSGDVTQIGSSENVAGGAEFTMPAAGVANVVINNSAKFTAPLVVTKSFTGTTGNAAPEGFDADFTVYEGNSEAGTQIGSVNYSDFVDGSYTFWLEEGKTYTVVETVKDPGQTGPNVQYLSTTVSVNDGGVPSTQSSLSASVNIEQNSTAHSIDFTNIYGEPAGTLLITKNVTGIDAGDVSKLNGITFTITGAGLNTPIEKTLADFVLQEGSNYAYTLEIPNLTPGAYTVTESNNTVDGYDLLNTSSPLTKNCTIISGNRSGVTFNNNYKHSDTYLTISKDVTGNMGDTSKSFGFTLTLHQEDNGQMTYYTQTLSMVEAGTTAAIYTEDGLSVATGQGTDGHTYQFSLANDQTIQIQVPYGYMATVTETSDGYTTTTTLDSNDPQPNKAQVETETMSNHTIKYENRRDPVAPTGLESNHTAPYTILVTVAGIAGLALIGGIVARRVRRRREE